MASESDAERVHPLIDHLARVARGNADAALEAVGVRLRHVVALTLLRDHGDATQQSLITALRLDPSNVVGLLNELEGEGLVERRRHPDDRRRHVVALTAAGRERLAQADRALLCVEDELLAGLDVGERAQLYGLLFKATGGRVRSCSEDPCAEAAREDSAGGGPLAGVLDEGGHQAH